MVGKKRFQRFFAAAGITAVGSLGFAAMSLAAGPSIFVTNNASSSVSALAIADNGSLAVNGFASAGMAGSETHSIAVSPDGATVYATNNSAGVNTVAAFTVGADGKLTVKGPAVATGENPVGVVVSPDGRYVYIANNHNSGGDASVSQYVVQQDGRLAPQNPAAFSLTGFSKAQRLVVSPNGKNLYVSSSDAAGKIVRISIDPATGKLATADMSTIAGANPLNDVVISPNGKHLYAVGGSQVQHLIVADTGSLTLSAAAPVNVGMNASGVVISPDAKNLYVINRGDSTISTISLAADGSLSLNGPTVSTALEPIGIAVSPSGRFVYTASYNSGNAGLVSTYSVGSGNGRLTQVGTPVSTGQNGAVDLVVAPAVGVVARFDVASTGIAGSDSIFDASASSASGARINSYQWEFGDGQTETTTTPHVAHKFANAGEFTVKLTVADDSGCSAQSSVFIGKTMLCSGLAKPQASQSIKIAATPVITPPPPPSRQCIVPNLSRISLGVAKKRLASAACRLGKVKKPKKNARHAKRAKLVVISQSRKRGLTLAADTKINITLGWRVLKKKK